LVTRGLNLFVLSVFLVDRETADEQNEVKSEMNGKKTEDNKALCCRCFSVAAAADADCSNFRVRRTTAEFTAPLFR